MMWFDQHTKQKQKSRKIPDKFLNNPGIKNKGKSRPEKSRDPGIWQNPVPENPGIENLDPARACQEPNEGKCQIKFSKQIK